MAARLHPEFHAEVIKELYGELECSWSLSERDGFFEAIRANIRRRSASTFQSTCSAFCHLVRLGRRTGSAPPGPEIRRYTTQTGG
jgi:hypothetical protein